MKLDKDKIVRYSKRALVTAIAAAALYGTFGTIDDSRLKQNGKKEVVIVLANQKGSTAGILLGGINIIEGDTYGIALGGVNSIEGDTYGIALGLVGNIRKGNCYGCNIGVLNGIDGKLSGIELGIINGGNKRLTKGTTLENALQIGILNCVDSTAGAYLQLGLWNQSDERKSIGINFGYKGNKGKKNDSKR